MRKSRCAHEMFRLMVRIFKITCDYVRGYWAMRKIEQPSVTILGGYMSDSKTLYGNRHLNLLKYLTTMNFRLLQAEGQA